MDNIEFHVPGGTLADSTELEQWINEASALGASGMSQGQGQDDYATFNLRDSSNTAELEGFE